MALGLGDQAGGSSSSVQEEQTVYLSVDSNPTLPGGGFVFDADFARDGADLVLSSEGHSTVIVRGYFDLEDGLDLWTEDGHFFSHQLVETLAGPLTPGLYAEISPGAGAEEIGKVAVVEGEAWAVRTDGVREALATDSSVFQGDVLETAKNGALEIIFVDGMQFSMAGDTRITIDEMIYNPNESEGSSILSVVKGSFIFITGWIAGTGPDAMQVKTPAGTIGIRGTRVGCVVDSEGGTTSCSLLEDEAGHVGKLAFTNATGTVLLTQLFETVVGISFNSELDTRVLDEIQLRTLLGDIYDEAALETEAPPVVQSSGSVFLPPDFDIGDVAGLEALVASGVLDEVATLSPAGVLAGLDFVLLEDGLIQTPPTSIAIGEDSAQLGTPTSGDLGFVIGGGLGGSVTIDGLTVTADGVAVALTSGGDPVQTRFEDNGLTMVGFVAPDGEGPQAGTDVFVFSLNPAAGTFSFTLQEPLDHLDPTAVGPEDTIGLSFEVTGQLNGLAVTSQIGVTIQDDGPSPVDNVAQPQLGAEADGDRPVDAPDAPAEGPDGDRANTFGLLIAIDVSTSMNNELTLANGETTNRLDLSKLAAENLGRKFFEIGGETGGDFRVSLIVFANGTEILSPSEGFTDFGSFAEAIRNVTDANGYPDVSDGTNFFDAVADIEDVARDQLLEGQAEDAENTIYFISDGFVTTGQPVSESGWEDFLLEKGVTSVAVAVDPGDQSVAPLLDVNFPDEPGDPLVLTGADDLAAELASAVQPVSSGNLLTDAKDAALGLNAADDFGTDGFGQIVSIEVDGTIYSYDAANDLISGGGAPLAGSQLSIQTAIGGQLDFDFSSGDYRYQGPGYDHAAEKFSYTISDRDGDTATADLIVNPGSFTFSLTGHPAGSFTLFGFDQNTDSLEITDVVDSDQDGDTDITDLINLGVTLSQDPVTSAVTLNLNADTSIVLDGIQGAVASLQELEQVTSITITG